MNCRGKGSDSSAAWILLGVWALTILFPLSVALAEDSPPPLRFRRVGVPADRLSQWAGGKERYLPLGAREFQRLLEQLRSPQSRSGGTSGAEIRTAVYRARFVGAGTLVGRAELEIRRVHEAPVFLPLAPCRLAIGEAWWNLSAAGAPQEKTKAVLGVDAQGRMGALVERSGRLVWQWSLQGRQCAGNCWEFLFTVPACPVSELTMKLPPTLRPEVAPGLIVDRPASDEEPGTWRIRLPGATEFRVLLKESSAVDVLPAAGLRESRVYRCSPRGLDVSAQWRIRAAAESPSEIRVLLDPGLQLITARYGDREVPWTAERLGKEQGSRVVITLPELLPRAERVLRLGAIAPLMLDRPWRLPRLRPENLLWEEGETTLIVPQPLLLQGLAPRACRQTAVEPLSEPQSGETVRFQCFEAGATLEVRLMSRRPRLLAVAATTVEVGSGEVAARVVTDLCSVDIPQFAFSADVAPSWWIDAVQSQPPRRIADWSVEPQSNGKRTLGLHFVQGLAPDRTWRLIIRARRLRPPTQHTLRLEDLLPLRIAAPWKGRRLVAVQTTGPFDLRLRRRQTLKQLTLQDLSPSERTLFDVPPGALLFEEQAAAGAEFTVEQQRPRYTGSIRVEAFARGKSLRETFVLSCRPESGPVDRVRVQLSPADAAPPRWTVAGEEEMLFPPRAMRAVQVAAERSNAVETWELSLRRPQPAPFEIRGIRERAWTGSTPLGLAALPEASHQEGLVVLHSPAALQIDNRRLKLLPPEPLPVASASLLRGTFRYNPARDVSSASKPALVVAPAPVSVTPPAFVWEGQLESWYMTSGGAQHVVRYDVQNSGAAALHFSLPADVTWQDLGGVWVDGRPVVWQKVSVSAPAAPEQDPAPTLSVPLPAVSRHPTVTLQYQSSAAPLRSLGRLTPPWCRPNVPVLERTWTLWLPPGFAVIAQKPTGPRETSEQIPPSRRLFGPLGRTARQTAFHVYSADDWEGLFRDPERRNAQDVAEVVLKRLGTKPMGAPEKKTPGAATWGALFGLSAVDSLPVPFYVDRWALERRGITPDTLLPDVEETEPRARTVQLLLRADLALLIGPRRAVLTSRRRAALSSGWEPLMPPAVWQVRPGPLADRLAGLETSGSDHRFLRAALWSRQPAGPSGGHATGMVPGFSPADTHDWTAAAVPLAEDDSATVAYAYRPTWRFLGAMVFLAVVGVMRWKGFSHPYVLLLGAGLLGLAALWVAEPYVPLATGGFLAILFCVAVSVLRRPLEPASALEALFEEKIPSPSQTPPEPLPETVTLAGKPLPSPSPEEPLPHDGSGSGIARLAAWFLVGASLFGGNGLGAAEDPSAAPAAAGLPCVLIPIDKQKKPVGEVVYLPESLYQQLYRQAAAVAPQPQGWLLSSARYEGAWMRESESGRVTLKALRAEYTLHVFAAHVRVRLPFRPDQAALATDGITLDGQPMPFQWEAAGTGVWLEVHDPGTYRLRCLLRPTVHTAGDHCAVEVSVPPIASAQWMMHFPAGVSGVEVPSALGPVRRQHDPPQWTAALGPTTTLLACWPETGRAETALEIEEFLWLKVQPGSVVADVRWKLRPCGRAVRRLQVQAESSLRLRPVSSPQMPDVKRVALPQRRQMITLQWPRPLTEETIVDLSFLWSGVSEVGTLRVPEIDLGRIRPGKRWLAVSLDPRLEYEAPRRPAVEIATGGEFLAAWGAAADPPDLAYRLPAAENGGILSSRPRPAEVRLQPELSLLIDHDTAEVFYDAQITTDTGYVFQYRLSVPPGLQVQSLSLRKEGMEGIRRWTQLPDGTLMLFLHGPIDGKQRLQLRGTLELPDALAEDSTSGAPGTESTAERRKLPLPRFQLEEARAETLRVQVYRTPAVRVEVPLPPPAAEDEAPPPLAEFAARGRLVCAFHSDADSPPVEIAVRPNRPVFQARQVTVLRQKETVWTVHVEGRLRVTQGVLDRLVFTLPESVQTPLTFDPPAELHTESLSKGRRRCVVRLPAEVAGEFAFRLTAPLTVSAGEPPALPDITLLHAEEFARWIVLPRQVQGQRVVWQTKGLRPAALPAVFAELAGKDKVQVYEVRRENPRAALRTAPVPQLAEVRLADLRLAWRRDGTCQGVAEFDIEPGGVAVCPLRLPGEGTLVSVAVDGVAMLPQAVAAGSWRIPLSSKRLPQHVTVVFRGRIAQPAEPGSHHFPFPTLGNLPVHQTLWTLAGPPSLVPAPPSETPPQTAARQALCRVENLDALLQTTANRLTEDTEERRRWYHLGLQRWASAAAAFRRARALLEDSEERRRMQKAFAAFDRQQIRLAQRLGLDELRTQVLAEPLPTDAATRWEAVFARRESLVRLAFAGPAPPLRLQYTHVPRPGAGARFSAAVLLLCGVLLAGWGLRRGLWTQLLHERPYMVGIACGVAWWWWLSPSFFGGIIILFTLLARLRAWRARRKAASSSTILIVRSPLP